MSTAAKRIPIVLSILLAAMLAAALAPQPALAEGAQVIDSGPCRGCTWTLYEGGLLTIEPTPDVENSGVLPSNDGNNWGDFWPWLAYRTELTSVYVSEGVKAGESVSFMFNGYPRLASADLSNLDVSGARSLENMFGNCESLESLDLSRWNVSSVEDMNRMFDNCASLESLDLSGWDTNPDAYMDYMFFGCSSLAELKLGAKTRLRGLPESEVNGRRDWYSPDEGRWFPDAEELNGYLGTLDEGAVCTLTKGTSIEGAEWSGIEGRTYTGEAQTQDPTLTLGGVALERGTHYELSYEGNVAAGTATVIATGTGAGGYAGAASTTFTIAKAKVAVPEPEAGLVYTGKPQTGVAAGDGYAVEGGSATAAGEHTATLTADANHVFPGDEATATVTFSIARAPLAVPEPEAGLVYDGRPQTGVAAGDGYAVEGGSATAAGEHTATLTADANHVFPGDEATASVNWSIAGAVISVPKAAAGLVYNGKPQTGVAGTAVYDVEGAATDAGDHVATVRLRDPSSAKWSDGTTEDKEVAFTIARAKVAVPKAKSGLVYNGKSKTGVPAGAGYTVKGGQATKAGSYTAALTADANHVFSTGKATASVAWSIAKAKGAVAVKARSSKPVAIAAGKSVRATKALKVTKNASKGKITYKKVKGNKKIVIKSGKITVKKGLKKGTYTIKVKATSAATANYKAATSKAITLKVRVK